jgi:hypothetical protein
MRNLVFDTTRKQHTLKLAFIISMMHVLHFQRVKAKMHKERKLSEDQNKEYTKNPFLHLKTNLEERCLQG